MTWQANGPPFPYHKPSMFSKSRLSFSTPHTLAFQSWFKLLTSPHLGPVTHIFADFHRLSTWAVHLTLNHKLSCSFLLWLPFYLPFHMHGLPRYTISTWRGKESLLKVSGLSFLICKTTETGPLIFVSSSILGFSSPGLKVTIILLALLSQNLPWTPTL